MTCAKKTDDIFNDDDFAFDPNAIDDNPFADDGDDDDDIFAADPSADGRFAGRDDAADEWLNLPGEASMSIALDVLERGLREDPFATTHLLDCLPGEGITPAPLSRYLPASKAYIAACFSPEQDDEAQEILRLITLYWLKKSRAFWLE
ncbi:MAG: hypothetical protein WBA42_18065 [Mesorhizobium sp.]